MVLQRGKPEPEAERVAHKKKRKKKIYQNGRFRKTECSSLGSAIRGKKETVFSGFIIKLIVLKSTNSSRLFELKCNVKHGKWPIQIANTNTTMGDLKQQPESTDRPSLKAFIANATTEIRGECFQVRSEEDRKKVTMYVSQAVKQRKAYSYSGKRVSKSNYLLPLPLPETTLSVSFAYSIGFYFFSCHLAKLTVYTVAMSKSW